MTDRERKKLACEIASLSVFRGVRNCPPLAWLMPYLTCEGETWEKLERYSDFVGAVQEQGGCFSGQLRDAVFADENPYIRTVAEGKQASKILKDNAETELELLSRLTELDCRTLTQDLPYQGYLAAFESHPVDMKKEYSARMTQLNRFGYGIFAAGNMFRVEGKRILPVSTADAVTVEDFVGYEEERRQVFENTRSLAQGRPAANVLLYGDAGTGKSSTVKACANAFADEGVRLIELRKDQLLSLPYVMGIIAKNPLKFIIFIDDLSFNKNDDTFSMLKAALEGSASAKAGNAVIYATSNRRHIVKEKFSDRTESDDIHLGDTVQELLSLSDRFGLTVYFSKPNKQLYLQIVHALARSRHVDIEDRLLDQKAEAFALAKGSRSPRAAEQFVRSLL